MTSRPDAIAPNSKANFPKPPTSLIASMAFMIKFRITCLAATLLPLSAVRPRHAEINSAAERVNGGSMTQAQCATGGLDLCHGTHLCMRYFLSTAGGEGARPIVFLNGDIDLGKVTRDFNIASGHAPDGRVSVSGRETR
jgi:hypothetical protein